MKLAWFAMIFGAACILEGIALVYTGYYIHNFWIMLCGMSIGIGLGFFPFKYGFNKRKDLILKRK